MKTAEPTPPPQPKPASAFGPRYAVECDWTKWFHVGGPPIWLVPLDPDDP